MNGNIKDVTRRAGYGGVSTRTRREYLRVADSNPKPRGGQSDVEGGEVVASRMRHALPDRGIHLHIDYAVRDGLGRRFTRPSYCFFLASENINTDLTVLTGNFQNGLITT